MTTTLPFTPGSTGTCIDALSGADQSNNTDLDTGAAQ